MVQGLGICTFTAKGPGSIPGWGTKISQATRHGQEKQKSKNNRGMVKVRGGECQKGAHGHHLCLFCKNIQKVRWYFKGQLQRNIGQ